MGLSKVTLVGQPVGRFPIQTSENDWVVEVSRRGTVVKRYVNASADRDSAIGVVVQALQCTADDIDWIKTHRRHEVEKCITMDDIIKSKMR